MRRYLSYLVLVAAAWLTGCAASGPKFADVSASFPPVKPSEGRVVFFRDNSVIGAAVRPEIRLDGEAVGQSARGSFFYVDTHPGRHVISATTEKESTLTIDVVAAKTHYVRSNITIGAVVGHVQFRQESEGTALFDLPTLAYTGRDAQNRTSDRPAPRPTSATTVASANSDTQAPTTAVNAGDEFEYKIIDQYSGTARKAVYRVDRIDDGRLVFNGGSRVEKPNGEIARLDEPMDPIGGDLDRAMPPRGWAKPGMVQGQSWDARFNRKDRSGYNIDFKMRATVGGTKSIQTAAGRFDATLISYSGWATYNLSLATLQAKVSIDVWYAPALNKVVRLASDIRMTTNQGGSANVSTKQLTELTAIRRK